MDVEELRNKKIFVKFIVPDELPSEGLHRMQYYTSFANEPTKYYFGLSLNTVLSKSDLKNMVKAGNLIELPEPVMLEFEKDLWLDTEGNVISALGYAPLKDNERKVVAKPKLLRKSHVLLMKHLNNNELPQVFDKHIIVD